MRESGAVSCWYWDVAGAIHRIESGKAKTGVGIWWHRFPARCTAYFDSSIGPSIWDCASPSLPTTLLNTRLISTLGTVLDNHLHHHLPATTLSPHFKYTTHPLSAIHQIRASYSPLSSYPKATTFIRISRHFGRLVSVRRHNLWYTIEKLWTGHPFLPKCLWTTMAQVHKTNIRESIVAEPIQ